MIPPRLVIARSEEYELHSETNFLNFHEFLPPIPSSNSSPRENRDALRKRKTEREREKKQERKKSEEVKQKNLFEKFLSPRTVFDLLTVVRARKGPWREWHRTEPRMHRPMIYTYFRGGREREKESGSRRARQCVSKHRTLRHASSWLTQARSCPAIRGGSERARARSRLFASASRMSYCENHAKFNKVISRVLLPPVRGEGKRGEEWEIWR